VLVQVVLVLLVLLELVVLLMVVVLMLLLVLVLPLTTMFDDSNFTIAHSPTVGHRDLVREFTDACRKQGIKPGLYFTTTDSYNKDNPNKAQIQLQQMTELTTQYGSDIAYFWFDHHGAPLW